MTRELLKQDVAAAAKAVLHRWDSPQWEWVKHGPTADLMHDLRRALAQPVQLATPPCIHEWVDARNRYVKSGEICRECGAIRSGNATKDGTAQPSDKNAEIARLTACLKAANASAEKFEREWYLRGDEIEAMQALPVPPFGDKRKAAMAVYAPPFTYLHGYIYDSQNLMVADGGSTGDNPSVEGAVAARVRGWGRLGYLPNGAELQDEVGQMMADSLNALYANITQPVQPDVSTNDDVLDMAYINSLPQPFIGRDVGGWEWPINDFEVSTGLLRIDVCGLLQVKTIGDFTSFTDGDGVKHLADAFYSDALPEDRAPISQPVHPAHAPTYSELDRIASDLQALCDRQALRLGALEAQPADITWCGCGDGYPAESFEAGVMSAIGKCSNCAAAMPDHIPDAGNMAQEWAPTNWSVYNSGAEVAGGLTFTEAWDYMTPERLARQWCAVCVVDESNQPIAKPAQERWSQEDTAYRPGGLAQPEQEPVAWISKHGVVYPLDAINEVHPINDLQPLYTSPPQRNWVGLTDEQVDEIVDAYTMDNLGYDIWTDGKAVARAVEAELKERNK